MGLTNKQMDEAGERDDAATAFSLEHASDNSPDYVGGRYGYLHGQRGIPVPVRPAAAVPSRGRLFPASRRSERKGAYEWRGAPDGQGIIAPLRDEASGALSDYRIGTNGANGVEVVGVA